MVVGWRYERRDYVWLLIADPPLCSARGSVVAVLNSCERRRRGQPCLCRFNVAEIVEDLIAIGAPKLGDDWLSSGLEPDDIPDFRRAVGDAIERAKRQNADQQDQELEHAVDRVEALARRLDRAIDREAGLSDEFADDVDE